MSKFAQMSARSALERMHLKPALMDRNAIVHLATNFKHLMQEDDDSDLSEEMTTQLHNNLCQSYGYSASTKDKPFAFAQGTAIIPVHGTLINRYGGYYYGMFTGYNFIRSQRAAAMADPDVERIIYDVNSNGGEAAGCFELSDESFALRGDKPTLAVVDSNCYSAAYAFASSADKISVTPSGGAGSIGVVCMHADISKMLEDFGVKITLITAGEHKADGNPYEKLSDEVKAEIQADVNAARDRFVALVARNRGIDEKVVRDTEARCYSADDALSLNLIDAVETPAQAVAAFVNGPTGSTNEGESMNEQELAQAKNEAAAGERTRIAGILTHDAAKDKGKLASHLALNTSMSVEDAVGMLAVAAPETAQAAAPAVTTQANADAGKEKANAQNANTNFMSAMNASEHPKVGVDANASGNDNEMSEDDQAIASLTAGFAANGITFDQK